MNIPRFLRLTLAFPLGLALLPVARAAVNPQLVNAIFQPDVTGKAALSPDGRILAYSHYSGGQLRIVLLTVDQPDKWSHVVVGRDANPVGTGRGAAVIAPQLRSLAWAGPSHLVYQIFDAGQMVTVGSSSASRIELRVVGADGQNDRKLVGRDTFVRTGTSGRAGGPVGSSARGGRGAAGNGPAAFPGTFALLGVAGGEKPSAIVEALEGDNERNLYRVDLATAERTLLAKAGQGGGTVLYDAAYTPRITSSSTAFLPGAGAGARGNVASPGVWYTLHTGAPATREASPPLMPDFELDQARPFDQRSFPLGLGQDPNLLYFASNVGRDNWSVHTLDLTTKQRTDLGFAIEGFDQVDHRREAFAGDEALVRDRDRRVVGIRTRGTRAGTRWLDPALARWQERLEERFPGKNIEIQGWDTPDHRVLALIDGPSDRGGFFVVEAAEPLKVIGAIPRGIIPSAALSPAEVLSFESAPGVRLTGSLVRPRGDPAALVLFCHDIPGYQTDTVLHEMKPHLQALAALGYAAAEINYRGTAGYGLNHLGVGRAEPDRLAVDDVRAAVREISTRAGLGNLKVVLMGVGFGGYIALRAAELNPDSYRAVVAINAPTDAQRWLNEASGVNLSNRLFFDAEQSRFADLRTRAGAIRAPVMLVYETGAAPRTGVDGTHATRLQEALQKAGASPSYLELYFEYSAGAPSERGTVFFKLASFIDTALKGAAAAAQPLPR